MQRHAYDVQKSLFVRWRRWWNESACISHLGDACTHCRLVLMHVNCIPTIFYALSLLVVLRFYLLGLYLRTLASVLVYTRALGTQLRSIVFTLVRVSLRFF